MGLTGEATSTKTQLIAVSLTQVAGLLSSLTQPPRRRHCLPFDHVLIDRTVQRHNFPLPHIKWICMTPQNTYKEITVILIIRRHNHCTSSNGSLSLCRNAQRVDKNASTLQRTGAETHGRFEVMVAKIGRQYSGVLPYTQQGSDNNWPEFCKYAPYCSL